MKQLVARLLMVVAVFSMVLAATPAFADTTSVTDANDEIDPDIRKLTLANRESAVVLTQKYEELDFVQVATYYIKWGEPQHYFVNQGNYDEDNAWETRLTFVKADGTQVTKTCGDMTGRRISDTESTKVRVPRSCLSKAPNRILAKGVATMGMFNSDETRNTAKVARG